MPLLDSCPPVDCFSPDIPSMSNPGFCPSRASAELQVLRYATPPTFRAASPVLYTSKASSALTDSIAAQLYPDDTHETAAQMAGTQRSLVGLMFQLLNTLPLYSCSSSVLNDEARLAAVCKLLQQGTGAYAHISVCISSSRSWGCDSRSSGVTLALS